MQAHTQSSSAAGSPQLPHPFSSVSEGAGLAHDAGNLLQGLALYCELLALPGVLRPEHLHYARELSALSERSGTLIHRLLQIDRVPPARRRVPRRRSRRSSPARVARTMVPLLRSLTGGEAAVTLAIAAGLPTLPFAAEVLERLLVNLTSNAAAALRQQGPRNPAGAAFIGKHIHIGLCGSEEGFRLTVMDNGPGMPPEAVAAFLNPGTPPARALRGLGRHVIHDLVKSTSGRLEIGVIPGRGTSVVIEWPLPGRGSSGSVLHR